KLRGLSNECKFVCPKDGCRQSLVDENIRDMILRHAPHDAIRKTALTDENPTLERIIHIASMYKTTVAANKTLHATEGTPEVNQMKSTYKKKGCSSSPSRVKSPYTSKSTESKLKSCPG